MEQAAPRGRLLQLGYGTGMLVIAAIPVLLLCLFVQWLMEGLLRMVRRWSDLAAALIYALVMGGLLKPFFAVRMLADAGRIVRKALEREDLEAARYALRSLVSRDRSQLTSELVAAAAIESLAENLSDSVVVPLFYYVLWGLPGAALYRLCNTFDSMIGYYGRYEMLGKAAGRLDDLLNLVPARLTALLLIAAAPFFAGDRRNAWRIWRRDARKTASPNAGQPMAAAAGALQVQLEKLDHYVLGDRPRAIVGYCATESTVWSRPVMKGERRGRCKKNTISKM